MIVATADLAALASRLASRAARIATAHATGARLERTASDSRWRRAELVWPLFAKG